MSRRTTAIADLDDDLDIKTMFDGWPEVRTPEPEAPTLCLESARRALERGGYVVLHCAEFRGRRGNFICEFELGRGTAPLIQEDDPLARHIGQVFLQAGFQIPEQNLVVGVSDGGTIRLGFLARFAAN